MSANFLNYSTALKTLRANNEAGFLKSFVDEAMWDSVLTRVTEVKSSGFVTNKSKVLVIGIGGSSLGLRAMTSVALSAAQKSRLFFLESPDPIQLKLVLNQLQSSINDLHICVISKSGNTIETLSLLSVVLKQFNVSKVQCSQKITAITNAAASSLKDWAKANNVSCLDVPEKVGGRYSAFTPVGLFPIGLLGGDLNSFKSGVKKGLAGLDDLHHLFAFCQDHLNRKAVAVFWMYSERLLPLGLWLQQLWAESLGKAKKLDGSAAMAVSSPLVLLGPNDQHSVLQQLVEGQRDKFVLFFADDAAEQDSTFKVGSEFAGLNYTHGKSLGQILAAERVATQRSLQDCGVESEELSVLAAQEGEGIAQSMVSLMVLVATLGVSIGINPFDQPGVEAIKKLAKDLLSGH
jgi:glucose-6-phosphate isomerase